MHQAAKRGVMEEFGLAAHEVSCDQFMLMSATVEARLGNVCWIVVGRLRQTTSEELHPTSLVRVRALQRLMDRSRG
uniref:Uncharacterized protein n=2 Tax=Nonomuraea gerenzanensis TaxID=93944 RepID=A0A1M4EH76_9ACTN|nr:hypothetical protein BN4615_P7833 [Nonomuraea gerenzanensis]